MKFRKKPVVIEAWEWDGSIETLTMLKDLGLETLLYAYYHGTVHTLEIATLKGASYKVDKGDWIIKGVKGEFYLCKPDIFELTYEPA